MRFSIHSRPHLFTKNRNEYYQKWDVLQSVNIYLNNSHRLHWMYCCCLSSPAEQKLQPNKAAESWFQNTTKRQHRRVHFLSIFLKSYSFTIKSAYLKCRTKLCLFGCNICQPERIFFGWGWMLHPKWLRKKKACAHTEQKKKCDADGIMSDTMCQNKTNMKLKRRGKGSTTMNRYNVVRCWMAMAHNPRFAKIQHDPNIGL